MTQASRRAIPLANPQPVVKVNERLEVEPTVLQPTTFKLFNTAVASVGTPVVIWTPATGLRWRAMGYTISASAAGSAIFKEASVAVSIGSRWSTGKLPAAIAGQ